MQLPPSIFNRRLVALRRDRAAKNFSQYDFLFTDTAENIAERLEDSSRKFPRMLEMGCRSGQLAALLQGSGRVERIIQADISQEMLQKHSGIKIIADEEYLPFAAGAFDLITSVLNLHVINDLPGALVQLRKALRPDGVFIAAMFGGETLTELRQSLMAAELAVGKGVCPHISPFVDVKDAGMLMQRAGFSMPVVDSYTVTTSYETVFSLMHDIRGMGESNVLTLRKNYALDREVLAHMATHYQQMFPLEEGRIKATFEIITITGMGF